MIAPKYAPYVVHQLLRRSTRTGLTLASIGVAMFLFVVVQALQQGVSSATQLTAADTTLIVFRENRFCPSTSRLPERYTAAIERIDGVESVIPIKIVVNNCGASLDVITYRGVPEESIDALARDWTILDGSLTRWRERSDAAIVGERLADRRGFKVGESFDSAGVSVTVAAIIRSERAQDQNVAYTHLPFLQQAASRGGLGEVTQFAVRVSDQTRLESVAAAIDETFRSDAEPTTTRSEKAFVAQAGADILEIVQFTRVLGWACLAAVLALVTNAIVLSMRDRIKEHAVLQTLGFRGGLIGRLVVSEGLLLGMLGGGLGAAAAYLFVRFGRFSLSNEGLSINISADGGAVLLGVLVSAAVGVLAGLAPAYQASRRQIADCFRSV
jgi:putative ABC transport system permease protein